MSSNKTMVHGYHEEVGLRVQQLIDEGYTRVAATKAGDGVFDIEGSGRKGYAITDALTNDSRIKEGLPELKRMRAVFHDPKAKALMDIIIKEAER